MADGPKNLEVEIRKARRTKNIKLELQFANHLEDHPI